MSSPSVRFPAPEKTALAGGMAIVLGIAAAKLLLHLHAAPGYGHFGDELYFLACGEHLDWGYTDQPPLIAAIAWLVRHTLGTSAFAIRVLPAVVGAPLVVLAGLMARELGGGRFAMGLSALATGLVGYYLVMHHIFTMNAFEPLFWTGGAYVVVRIVKTGDQRLWLWFGLLAGIGMMNKYSMAVFGLGIVVGLLATSERKAFRHRWIWIAGGIATLIFLPNVIWNIQHDWPFLQMQQDIRESGHNVVLSPLAFLGRQVMNANPATLPLWVEGTLFLLFRESLRPFRVLGWAFLAVPATFIVTGGKDYCLAPAFPMVLAAGAVGFEALTAQRGRVPGRVALVGLYPHGQPWENGPILVCREPRVTLREAWPRLRSW